MKDLTTVDGTYSQLLAEHITEINAAISKTEVSAEELKQLILGIIEEAKDTNAKRTFIFNLSCKSNKMDIAFYVTNAYLCGSGMGVNAKGTKYQ